jgi:D-alanyl-D-alanine carboxypeptidase/D-alanyl-D-alanine-endopeptidase (penicillin-binding protein 4)
VRPPPAAVLAPQGAPFAAPAPAFSAGRIVAALWAESGGTLRGRVASGSRAAVASALPARWSSEFLTPLPELIREMNKTSNNVAARNLLLSLSEEPAPGHAALREAQDRVHAWLRAQGLADGDIRIDIGSGQSRAERGKPRAMVHLLLNAWRSGGAKALLDSLPIAGVDGTLAHRMQHGSATGQAYLKTGTLSDTRALAGYVHAKSGKVYAVAAMVNHPQASRATPALDAFIEWVANNG